MREQVRLGIIGTSWWSDLAILPALSAHPQAAVVALCGRNRERAEELAGRYGVSAVCTDYREMYKLAGLDGVVVASPDDLHYPMTMDALAAGLHVLCEKPMALTLADAQAMLARAEAAQVRHMVHFTWRALPTLQYMKELIEEGYLGQPYQCTFSFIGDYGRSGEYAWRFDQRRANGILGDLGAHMADFALWLVGDIATVSAQLSSVIPRPGPENGILDPANDVATVALRFVNGALGTIQVSAAAYLGDRGIQQQVVLHGAQGTLETEFTLDRGWELRGARSGEPQIRVLPIPERIAGPLDATQTPLGQFWHRAWTQSTGPRAFVDSILEDRPSAPSFADGVKAQAIIEAAFRSAGTGGAAAVV
jgi:predicted dehydrogenase